MRELVQELLQLTEKENSMVKCKKEYVNLTNLINEIAYELKYFIEEKSINIQIDLEKDIIVEGELEHQKLLDQFKEAQKKQEDDYQKEIQELKNKILSIRQKKDLEKQQEIAIY